MLKPIPGFPNYGVSDDGHVWNYRREKWLKDRTTRQGRVEVVLTDANGRLRPCLMHRLVLLTFVGPCPAGREGCHNNGVPTDNRLTNLRWDSRSGNAMDAVRQGTHQSTKQNGERNPNAKLTDSQVEAIRYMRRMGQPVQLVASAFHISIAHVSRVANGRRRQKVKV